MNKIILSLSFFFCFTLSAFSSTKAVVNFIEGDVTIDGLPAKVGQVITLGSVVKAADDAKIDITLVKDVRARLIGGKVSITSLGEKPKLNLKYGKLYSQIRRPVEYKIETPHGTAGVRGTQFLYEVQLEKEKDYVCVCEGSVSVIRKGSDTAQIVKAGEDLWLKKAGPLKEPVFSPDMNSMTKKIFADMASKIAKVPSYTRRNFRSAGR